MKTTLPLIDVKNNFWRKSRFSKYFITERLFALELRPTQNPSNAIFRKNYALNLLIGIKMGHFVVLTLGEI